MKMSSSRKFSCGRSTAAIHENVNLAVEMAQFLEHLRRLREIGIGHTPARIVVVEVRTPQKHRARGYVAVARIVVFGLLVLEIAVLAPVVVRREVDVSDPVLLAENEIQEHDFGKFAHPERHLAVSHIRSEILVYGGVLPTLPHTPVNRFGQRSLRTKSQVGRCLLEVVVLSLAPARTACSTTRGSPSRARADPRARSG